VTDEGENGRVEFHLQENVTDFNLSTSGELRVANQLDALANQQYILTIVAQDGGMPPQSTSVTIAINIEPSPVPVFDQSTYNATVLENNPPHTFVVQVQASSRDPESSISYSLTNDSAENESLFSVDPNSGNVTVLESLDREERDSYTVTILASTVVNGSELSDSTEVVVRVLDDNDNPPRFENDTFTFAIPETTPNGSVVATLLASDEDVGENSVVLYSLSQPHRDNEPLLFSINDSGTLVTARSLVDQTELYSLTLQASNPASVGNLSTTAVVNITVEHVNNFVPEFDTALPVLLVLSHMSL